MIVRRRSIAKSVGCFQRRLFVCLFVCQHDNFQTSKHRTMKLRGRCAVQKSRPSSNLGVIAPPGCAPSKCGVGTISAGCLFGYRNRSSLWLIIYFVLSQLPPSCRSLPSSDQLPHFLLLCCWQVTNLYRVIIPISG